MAKQQQQQQQHPFFNGVLRILSFFKAQDNKDT